VRQSIPISTIHTLSGLCKWHVTFEKHDWIASDKGRERTDKTQATSSLKNVLNRIQEETISVPPPRFARWN
jgi:N12 class adenine-specific DNA methylase